MRIRTIAIVLAALAAFSVFAGPADEVREAETNFAKAFADRNGERFASFIAADATFIVNGKAVEGRDAIVKAWSVFLAGDAPFSWRSEQAVVDASGTLAMSIGGVFDPSGKRVAGFTSFWKKTNGQWNVVFDGPSAPVCQPRS